MKPLQLVGPTLVLMNVGFLSFLKASEKKSLPNIIYILADDLGYGDLSVYGQQKFKTPHIDQLAKQGMLFTQHYSGSTVSAPSRACLMTGLHTKHTPIKGNVGVDPEGQMPLPSHFLTIAESLKAVGYSTGAFGKWGLGAPGSEGDPINQGFDVFFGYNCQTLAHNYYPDHLWDNTHKVVLAENNNGQCRSYAPDLILKKSLQFIDEHKEKPFFMYYSTNLPHAELVVPKEKLELFKGKFFPENSYMGVDFGQEGFRQGPYASQPESHAAFAAMVAILDEQVGALMEKLQSLRLENETLIVFTSDNGPHREGGGDPDFFDSNGMYRGYKRDLYEGGIRVPMIVIWPEKVKAGTVNNHVSAFWDVFPTFAEITHSAVPQNTDGLSFLPSLLNKKGQKEHEFLYWEFHEQGGKKAIRKGDWKLILLNANEPSISMVELYNLEKDPSEQVNLSNQYPELIETLIKHLK